MANAMTPPEHQGFILQATYRVQHGVPVVHLFGRLHDGRTFLVRDHQQTPHFYVARQHARAVSAARVLPCTKSSLAGEPLARVEVQVPGDAPRVRDALHGQGIATYEADVRFAMRYLIDRGIKGAVNIAGQAEPGQGTDLVFDDPQLTPATLALQPKVLSFDIFP